jgi:hypothetical protein
VDLNSAIENMATPQIFLTEGRVMNRQSQVQKSFTAHSFFFFQFIDRPRQRLPKKLLPKNNNKNKATFTSAEGHHYHHSKMSSQVPRETKLPLATGKTTTVSIRRCQGALGSVTPLGDALSLSLSLSREIDLKSNVSTPSPPFQLFQDKLLQPKHH